MLKFEDFILHTMQKDILKIENLSLDTKKYLIVGQNRAGKSLFCQTLFEHYREFSGRIIFQDKAYPLKKSTTLFIEVESHLLKQSTVEENIFLPFPKVTARLRNKVDELLKLTNLELYRDQQANVLSFSQQKQIELIRAVVQYPKMLLIDDFDLYFDDRSLTRALAMLDSIIENGGIVIATAKHRMSSFDETYMIHQEDFVKI